ncbi:MAG: DUF6179 domain-containing protein [Mobilitalea sp.]
MNQVEKRHLINENILDQGFYFQSLFQEACRKHLLSDSQIARIQLELVELMAKEVERYTNDESSSVQIEKAQELFQSITYSIGVYLKTVFDMEERIDLLIKEKVSVLFYLGMDSLSSLKTKSKLLLQNLQESSLKVNNYAYQDTILAGIPEFFHDYNIEFGANEIPGSIDYPLYDTITNLLGIEYIYEYLHWFTLEENFLKRFSNQNIDLLMQSFNPEAEHLLINIFELVLTNVLGCELLGQKNTELNIHATEREWLQKSLEKLSTAELQNRLEIALDEIGRGLSFEVETLSYAKAALPQIAIRLKQNLQTGTLDKLFLSFSEHELEEEFFEDGIPMDNEKLREMIEEINDCRFTADKVAIIRETVRSLSDLIELLEECFYGEEYVEVFQLLSDTEIAILKNSIIKDAGFEGMADYEPQKEWQEKLLAM